MAVVRSYYGWSAAAGLLPLPWFDLAAIVGVQIRMLQKIAHIYRKPFPAHQARPMLIALMNGTGSMLVAGPAFSIIKAVPFIGPVASLFTLPALAAASCYATGRVFIQHFEMGGTLLDFNPAETRAYYNRQFEAARARAV